MYYICLWQPSRPATRCAQELVNKENLQIEVSCIHASVSSYFGVFGITVASGHFSKGLSKSQRKRLIETR